MEESFDQKVIRNVQGNFAVYKTEEVVGEKSMVPNLEWSESDDVDKFFAFAKSLGAKVIYIAEGEDVDETSGQTKSSIVQVGFLHDGIMHHINYADEDEDDEESEEYEYIDETQDEDEDQPQSTTQPSQSTLRPPTQPQAPPPAQQPATNTIPGQQPF